MTEWILDNKADRFLAGMMVRKSQREDNDAEELEMYTLPAIIQKPAAMILRIFRSSDRKVAKRS